MYLKLNFITAKLTCPHTSQPGREHCPLARDEAGALLWAWRPCIPRYLSKSGSRQERNTLEKPFRAKQRVTPINGVPRSPLQAGETPDGPGSRNQRLVQIPRGNGRNCRTSPNKLGCVEQIQIRCLIVCPGILRPQNHTQSYILSTKQVGLAEVR